MKKSRLTVSEAVRNFADIMNRVLYRSESFEILRGKRIIAEIHPSSGRKTITDLITAILSAPALTTADRQEMTTSGRSPKAKNEALRDPWES